METDNIDNHLLLITRLSNIMEFGNYVHTRMHPLRGYIPGVLMHTTAWD